MSNNNLTDKRFYTLCISIFVVIFLLLGIDSHQFNKNNSCNAQEMPGHIKEWLSNQNQIWFQGMDFEEVMLDKRTGQIIYTITEGAFMKAHQHSTKESMHHERIPIKGILFKEYNLYIWLDDGVLKQSFDAIQGDKKKILFLWKIKILIENEVISDIETIDYRGFNFK